MTNTENPAPKKTNPLKIIAAGVIGAFLVVAGIVWMYQGVLIYGKYTPYEEPQKGWAEVKIDVPSEGKMIAYYNQAQEGKPTVLFLHGRGYGYAGSVNALQSFLKQGVGAMIVEYPGYGGNRGSYTEQSAKDTAQAGYKWLIDNGVKAEDLVVYGEGMGTGPAIAAAQKPNRRLIIVSGFSSVTQMVQDQYPLAPDFLIKDGWNNLEEIKKVPSRVTVVHGTDNKSISIEQAKDLANASKTKLIEVPGNHNLAFDTGLQFSLAASVIKAPK